MNRDDVLTGFINHIMSLSQSPDANHRLALAAMLQMFTSGNIKMLEALRKDKQQNVADAAETALQNILTLLNESGVANG